MQRQPRYVSKIPTNDYLEDLLKKEHIIPLVTIIQGKIVAGLVAYVLEKFEQERSEVYIYDLAVKEGFRRQGIATALINKLKQIATSYKAWVIFVQADQGDEPAIKLYESLGIKEDVHHFDIPVLRSR
ncbi:MAG: GNAT family N-acetyltransferase [Symploca sp. SIO1A3]|nr:GNAT family N-acetyltransferase [Symploca sp. SIO1A3]